MGAALRVGEIVSYVEGGTGQEVAGLVVEIRRSDSRILNLESDRAYWLPNSHLRRGARSIRKGTATSLLSSLVLYLEGSELEVEKTPGDGIRAQIGCPGLDAEGVDQIRRYFGSGLRSLRILPGGLGKVLLVVEFLP